MMDIKTPKTKAVIDDREKSKTMNKARSVEKTNKIPRGFLKINLVQAEV